MLLRIEKDKILEENKIIPDSDLPKFLGSHIELAEDVTFGRIFELCIQHKDIFNLVFYSNTRGFNIDHYIDDFNSKNTEKETEIDYLEVCGYHEHMIFDKDDVEDTIFYSLHGININTDMSYSISLSSLSSFKNIPIKFNDELKITIDNGLSFKDIKKRGLSIEDKYQTVHIAHLKITLFDFIAAILNDITFHGAPDNKKDFMDKLNKESDEINEKLKRGESVGYEMKTDENGDFYFLKDGVKDYLFKKDDEDSF